MRVKVTHTGSWSLFPRVRCTFDAAAGEGTVPGEALAGLAAGEGELTAFHAVRMPLPGVNDVDLLFESPLVPPSVDPGERMRPWDNDGPESWWPVLLK